MSTESIAFNFDVEIKRIVPPHDLLFTLASIATIGMGDIPIPGFSAREADRLVVEVACYSAAGRWRMDCSICFRAVSTTGELARNVVHESIVRVQRIE